MTSVSTRQTYHLEPPRGLLNDPNGLAYFDGKYHVFFQWNRFAKDHSSKEWGWFRSPDLVRWEFMGSALVPDQPYDQGGVLSGSAVADERGLLLYYTGRRVVRGERRVAQCAALMSDGRHPVKLGPVVETPAGYTRHFRDPSVRRLPDGRLLMVLGAQRDEGKGSVVAFVSRDGLAWEPAGELARSREYEMIECPELASLPGGRVLLYCPQRRDNVRDACGESFSAYKPVELDEGALALRSGDQRDLDRGWEPVDLGFDLYAPQTLPAPDGRAILLGWMSRLGEGQEAALAAAGPSVHCLTLPREVELVGGRLRQVPARELSALLGGVVEGDGDRRGTGGPGAAAGEAAAARASFSPASRAYRVALTAAGEARPLEVSLNGGEATLSYDPAAGTLSLLRRDWAAGGAERRDAEVGALADLEVWADQSSVEVFANGGSACLSARVMPLGERGSVELRGGLDGWHVEVRDIVAPLG